MNMESSAEVHFFDAGIPRQFLACKGKQASFFILCHCLA